MADYDKALKNELLKTGCYFVRHGKGSHDVWYSPATGCTFPVNHKVKSRHTANAILKEAGLSFRFR